MEKIHALAERIDGKVVDYVDEVDRMRAREINTALRHCEDALLTLRSEINTLEHNLNELRASQKDVHINDKYALTKTKLIRLMKDMGYYE